MKELVVPVATEFVGVPNMTASTNTTHSTSLRDAVTVGLYSVGIGAGALAGFITLLLVA